MRIQKQTPSPLLTILAAGVMLVFTFWISWVEGPLLALAPLAGAIWLASQIKHGSKTKTISMVILGLVAAIVVVLVIYFVWISSFTF
jgi:hypothetical protein